MPIDVRLSVLGFAFCGSDRSATVIYSFHPHTVGAVFRNSEWRQNFPRISIQDDVVLIPHMDGGENADI
jgi:hypothetical protein